MKILRATESDAVGKAKLHTIACLLRMKNDALLLLRHTQSKLVFAASRCAKHISRHFLRILALWVFCIVLLLSSPFLIFCICALQFLIFLRQAVAQFFSFPKLLDFFCVLAHKRSRRIGIYSNARLSFEDASGTPQEIFQHHIFCMFSFYNDDRVTRKGQALWA